MEEGEEGEEEAAEGGEVKRRSWASYTLSLCVGH